MTEPVTNSQTRRRRHTRQTRLLRSAASQSHPREGGTHSVEPAALGQLIEGIREQLVRTHRHAHTQTRSHNNLSCGTRETERSEAITPARALAAWAGRNCSAEKAERKVLHTDAHRHNSEDDPGNSVVTAALPAGKRRAETLGEAGRRQRRRTRGSRSRCVQRHTSRAIAPAKHLSRARYVEHIPGCHEREDARLPGTLLTEGARQIGRAPNADRSLSRGGRRCTSRASDAVTVAATARPPRELDATPT